MTKQPTKISKSSNHSNNRTVSDSSDWSRVDLSEALKSYGLMFDKHQRNGEKVQRILNIWESSQENPDHDGYTCSRYE